MDKDLEKVLMLLQVVSISSTMPTLKAINKTAMDELLAIAADHADAHAEALAKQRAKEQEEEAERVRKADALAALARQEAEKAQQEKIARQAAAAKAELEKEAKNAAMNEVKDQPTIVRRGQ